VYGVDTDAAVLKIKQEFEAKKATKSEPKLHTTTKRAA
jgi:hypothetical protein